MNVFDLFSKEEIPSRVQRMMARRDALDEEIQMLYEHIQDKQGGEATPRQVRRMKRLITKKDELSMLIARLS